MLALQRQVALKTPIPSLVSFSEQNERVHRYNEVVAISFKQPHVLGVQVCPVRGFVALNWTEPRAVSHARKQNSLGGYCAVAREKHELRRRRECRSIMGAVRTRGP